MICAPRKIRFPIEPPHWDILVRARIGKFDKTGKRVNIKDKTMQGFYEEASDKESDDDSESEETAPADPSAQKFYDEDGNF